MIKSISALAGVKAENNGDQLLIREIVDRDLWQIDGWAPTEVRVRERLGEVSGLSLSEESGAALCEGQRRLMWAGPARYWLAAEHSKELAASLRAMLEADDGHVMDISHSRTVFQLQGPAAQAVLQSGIGVDLDIENFAVNRVILTGLAHHTPVTLHRIDEQHFELYVYRSYAQHTLEWLLATARPLGVSWGQ